MLTSCVAPDKCPRLSGSNCGHSSASWLGMRRSGKCGALPLGRLPGGRHPAQNFPCSHSCTLRQRPRWAATVLHRGLRPRPHRSQPRLPQAAGGGGGTAGASLGSQSCTPGLPWSPCGRATGSTRALLAELPPLDTAGSGASSRRPVLSPWRRAPCWLPLSSPGEAVIPTAPHTLEAQGGSEGAVLRGGPGFRVIRCSEGDLDLNPWLPQPEGAPGSDSGRGQTPPPAHTHTPALAPASPEPRSPR